MDTVRVERAPNGVVTLTLSRPEKGTEDTPEAIRAFLEKRAPKFKGR